MVVTLAETADWVRTMSQASFHRWDGCPLSDGDCTCDWRPHAWLATADVERVHAWLSQEADGAFSLTALRKAMGR